MAVEDVAENLQLASELPGAETIAWRVDELYQRDIDWVRVERQIVPYLNNLEVPQFFNSLTVALLPFDVRSGGLAREFSDDIGWDPPRLDDEGRFEKVINVGPVTLGFWESWSGFSDLGFRSGQLRWNNRQVFAAVIDGQHRLAALKAVAGGRRSALTETRVPVLLLIFDSRLGYVSPHNSQTVEILRALFIDLNKHAQSVTRARQLLLDDRDPHAVCVRRMVGSQLREDLTELRSEPPRLPLAVVDWHSEQAKFDEGPYVTTVLGLDWIVTEVLGTRPIRDFTDYGAVRKQLDRIEAQVGMSLWGAKRRLDDLETVSLAPFVYSDEDLEKIGTAFGGTWSGALCHLLTAMRPYASFLEQRVARQSLSLDFQTWYMLYRRQVGDVLETQATAEYRRFMHRLQVREDPLGERQLIDTLGALEASKANNLAFNVAFQRALVLAFIEYGKIQSSAIDEIALDAEVDFPEFDLEEEDDAEAEVGGDVQQARLPGGMPSNGSHLLARAHEFVGAMNDLVAGCPELLSIDAEYPEYILTPYLWAGTLRKAEGGIDFTQTASQRAKEVLFLVAVMHLYSRHVAQDGADFDEFWGWVHDDEGPSVARRASRATTRYAKQGGGGGRVLMSFGEEYYEEMAREQAERRLRALWAALRLG